MRVSVPTEERFTARVDPGFETVDTGRLLGALAPALERLEEFLRVRQRGVLALRLTLAHRRCLPTMFVLRLVVPEYRAARFTALLAARFESLVLPGPVRHVDLAAGRLRRLPGDSVELWQPGEHGGDARGQAPEFLQSLMARLGERAVYGLALVPGHRPEHQSRSVWPQLHGNASTDPHRPDYRSRPLGLLSPPQPLQACADTQGHIRCLLHQGQSLQLVTGPERIETGWWDGGDITRDYYIARAAEGALWWVFRECDEARRWYVHGCFA
jgi:protein ImuB